MDNIILFDGVCHFCDRSVQFIIKRDRAGFYKFASLQSDIGQELLVDHRVLIDIDSFILIKNNKVYTKSTAALHVTRHLDGPWKALFPFIIIPRPIRDFFYNIIAKNRYKWFGKKDSCTLPSPDIRERFLS